MMALLFHCGTTAWPTGHLTCSYQATQEDITKVNRVSGFDSKQLHARLLKKSGRGGRPGDLLASDGKLAILYSRNSSVLNDARKLFDKIPHRTLPLYAALIASYSRSQRWWELLSVLGLMIHQGLLPDKFLLPTILKACSSLELLNFGRMIHGYVLRNKLGGFDDVFVGNALIDMYSNCGDLDSSTKVFDMMPERDVVSWTALVNAYMDVGLLDAATDVFESSIKLNGGVKTDVISWNAMVSGFARNGEIDEALHYLQLMQESGLKPRVTTWNGIISGCVQNGYFEDALDVLSEMLCSFVNPNAVTITSILPACGALHDLKLGQGIHAYALKSQIVSNNIFVQGSLIDMYSKCGRRDNAERAFMVIENKNTTVCNEMITAYVNEGDMISASEFFHQMQNDSSKPDVITYNTMLGGYALSGQKEEAYGLFSEMTGMGLRPSVVSLNVLLSGFQQSGLNSEALTLFRIMQSPSANGSNISGCDLNEMLNAPIQPNTVTSTSVLSACADLEWLPQGKEIHGYILRNGYDGNIYVLGALVDMYAKCHDMSSADRVFYTISDKNMATWNILMAGHVNNGQPREALKLFSQMREVDLQPNSTTLRILLSACSHIATDRPGRELHCYIVKRGFHEFLSCSLVDMYAKYGGLMQPRLVSDSEIQ